jgi:hypothetical protein
MCAGRFEDAQAVIGGPLKQVAQIVAVSVECPTAVSGEGGYGGELGFIGRDRLGREPQEVGMGIKGGHESLLRLGRPSQHRSTAAGLATMGIDSRRTS